MNDKPATRVEDVSLEDIRTHLETQIKFLKDETATQILTQLICICNLVKEATKATESMSYLLADMQGEFLRDMGYPYKSANGKLFYDSSMDIKLFHEPIVVPGPLTDYEMDEVLTEMLSDFKENGIPTEYKEQVSYFKNLYKQILNADQHFMETMIQAKEFMKFSVGCNLNVKFFQMAELISSMVGYFP